MTGNAQVTGTSQRAQDGQQTQGEMQSIPIKAYRKGDRLTVAAPMPGLEPENVVAEVTGDGRLILEGEERGAFKGSKDEVLMDEWNPGPYRREVTLPVAVDGEGANVTYGNGVVVVVLPVAEKTRAARLGLEASGPTRGERVGHTGSDQRPTTTGDHRAAMATQQEEHGGGQDPPRA